MSGVSVRRRFDRLRLLQWVFLFLLAASAAQVTWWVYDQSSYTRDVYEETLRTWYRDLETAYLLTEGGEPVDETLARFPHLGFEDSRFFVASEALGELQERRMRHLRQYSFEGTFFFLVLLAAMGVIWHVLAKEADLHRRQENFLASVSHELKSPIASLRLSTETMAMRRLTEAKQAEILERSLADLDRLEGLVTAMLDTNRLEQGSIQLQRHRLALEPEIAAVLEQLGYREGRSRVKVEVEIPASLEVFADPMCVRTVLRNLIDNAFKACAGVDDPRLEVRGERLDRVVRVTVRDRGHGFDPKEADRLFEKFYRPGDEMRRTSPGTGLGLYIVQRCVDLEGGRVFAHSEGIGRGAEFVVEWPVREEAA